jgi:hypothetical protein
LDLGCRSEKSSGRGQILPDLQRQYPDIDQKSGEICTDQVILQPTTPKSDRLLGIAALEDKIVQQALVSVLNARF